MRRLLAVLVLAVLLLPAPPLIPPAAAACSERYRGNGEGDSFAVRGRQTCHNAPPRTARPPRSSSRPATATPGTPEPPRRVSVTVATCPGNRPDAQGRVEGLGCSTAVNGCPPGQWLGTTYTGDAVATPGRRWTPGEARCQGGPAPAPGEQPVPLPVLTAADLRRLPLPAAAATLQPGSGRVAVGLPVNVYATAGALTLPTTVLGFPVRVRATPVSYAWSFGDGGSLGPTRDPGAPYPDLRTTHTYTRPGRYAVVLTTTYAAEYSVAGGPWTDVEGTAAVAGAPVDLAVLAGPNVLLAPPAAG